jgi:hypothetical protein
VGVVEVCYTVLTVSLSSGDGEGRQVEAGCWGWNRNTLRRVCLASGQSDYLLTNPCATGLAMEQPSAVLEREVSL